MERTSKTPLNVGDIVTIKFNPYDEAVTQGMKRYNGRRAKVTKVTGQVKSSIAGKRKYKYKMYELKGIHSAYGIPYTFSRDMLVADWEVN